MLYDPKWEIEIKHDPFSLEGLIAWLENKPAAGNYNWEDCDGGCLVGIYARAIGMGEQWRDFHSKLFDADELSIAGDTPHTFGAALERARKALASRT
jgi:hypothetical protein